MQSTRQSIIRSNVFSSLRLVSMIKLNNSLNDYMGYIYQTKECMGNLLNIEELVKQRGPRLSI